MTIVLAMLAGGLGGVARFVADATLTPRLTRGFSWAIPLVNVSGSLALGILAGLTSRDPSLGPAAAILGVGFLGGYTTFSTASVDAVRLWRAGGTRRSVFYALVTLVGSLAAAAAGLALGGGAL